MVSVIIPVYNVEDYICNCVKSVLNQTYGNMEIILVDDGSTDKSGDICDKLESDDVRIRVIHQDNFGLSAARNTGIDSCRGEWIVFIDSDDTVTEDFVEILYKNCTEYDAALGQCELADNGEETLENYSKKGSVMAGRQMLLDKKYITSACGKIYHKSLFRNYRFPIGKLHEDSGLIYKLVYESERVVCIPAKMYIVNEREGSITRKKFTPQRLVKLDFYEEMADYFRGHKEEELVEWALDGYLLELFYSFEKVREIDGYQIYRKRIQDKYRHYYSQFMQLNCISSKLKVILRLCYVNMEVWKLFIH